jgi:hypothetical protein
MSTQKVYLQLGSVCERTAQSTKIGGRRRARLLEVVDEASAGVAAGRGRGVGDRAEDADVAVDGARLLHAIGGGVVDEREDGGAALDRVRLLNKARDTLVVVGDVGALDAKHRLRKALLDAVQAELGARAQHGLSRGQIGAAAGQLRRRGLRRRVERGGIGQRQLAHDALAPEAKHNVALDALRLAGGVLAVGHQIKRVGARRRLGIEQAEARANVGARVQVDVASDVRRRRASVDAVHQLLGGLLAQRCDAVLDAQILLQRDQVAWQILRRQLGVGPEALNVLGLVQAESIALSARHIGLAYNKR